jgi:dipeptidyl aminopeptidase/acylaminoacyl peptidase
MKQQMTESPTNDKITVPYGAFVSGLSAQQVANGGLRLSQPQLNADSSQLFYLEGRPAEGGRQVLVVKDLISGDFSDINEAPINIRSLVHEYGGGAFALAEPIAGRTPGLIYTDIAERAVWWLPFGNDGKWHQDLGKARKVFAHEQLRFADFSYDSGRNRIIAVCEDHRPHSDTAETLHQANHRHAEPANKIVALGLDDGEMIELAAGYDFYGFPRLSPDGRYLAAIAWRHPNMPWDANDLILMELDDTGMVINQRIVAGGPRRSTFQPIWGLDGALYFFDDPSGYWRPFRLQNPGDPASIEALLQSEDLPEIEFGLPMWVFGQSIAAFTDRDTLYVSGCDRGLWGLYRIALSANGHLPNHIAAVPTGYTEVTGLHASNGKLAMLCGSAAMPSSVVLYEPGFAAFAIIRAAADDLPSAAEISHPRVIEFTNKSGQLVYAFYYEPVNSRYQGPADQRPPLMVKCHGGPTGGASSLLNLGYQYYTNRGFAVVDVNYGGSTGFGREYRERLLDNWGLVDVQDAVAAVEYLSREQLIDPERVCISGGSAGGYTVLSALAFTDAFKAGASHYGIGDLMSLAQDTHKFESRYTDRLIGPYPQAAHIYDQRSPLKHVDGLDCPVIFFQGLEDKVVPPNQAEEMVAALRGKGLPVAYISYPGEQHGFRRAENIIRTIESEYSFFARIFGIKPIDPPEAWHKLKIENHD